jgi:protocatechuate 3,4-dioxygenase beta subunit
MVKYGRFARRSAMRLICFLVLTMMALLLAACGGAPQQAESVAPTAAAAVVTAVPAAATDVPTALPTAEIAPVEDTAVMETPPVEEATVEPQETAVTAPEPVTVTFFTPAQQEGPYYPPEKPADQDNDLVALAGAAGVPAGQVLEFGGRVYNAAGLPIEGAVIEIWQTDAAGVYLHPNDPGTESRDRNFQFYGQAQTGADGGYAFRTLLPGLYEPRPRHIHVKVLLGGQEVLTSQFYFAGEIDLQGAEALMLIDAQPAKDDAGNDILVGQRDIFLNVPPAG